MGTLDGVRIVEFAGIGPAPMAAMLLADMGATVLRVERPRRSGLGIEKPDHLNFLNRGRRSVVVDLKSAAGKELALSLVDRADAVIEGFRPGAMERLGLGPDVCLARRPRLVYGRITGWGQQGPLAQVAGHDLNYVALSGALDAIGRQGQAPTPPLNLVGDFSGSAYLCIGMLAAMLAVHRGGLGQVVDAAMVDSATSLMMSTYSMKAAGMHEGPRGTNLLDSGAPFYDVYQCADGLYVSIAPIEAKFKALLFEALEIPLEWVERSNDREAWPALRALLEASFRRHPRAHWCQLLEGSDACFAPVLSMVDAPLHPHQVARQAFIEIEGVTQPAPAPRFSRTPSVVTRGPERPGQSAEAAMLEWGYSPAEQQAFWRSGALVRRSSS